MNYKYNEIKEYFNNYLIENSEFINEILEHEDSFDLHHDAFNTDYYITGTYKATQWLGSEVFNIIQFIKEYEMDNFGDVNTDFSSPESIVNMYVYIIGETIVRDYSEKDVIYPKEINYASN